MKTLYETARDSLIVIESIASGSTTTNSLPHLARLAREGLTAIESADRAQQGEPVAWRRCKPCHAPRKGETCHKCGGPTFVPHESWEEPKLPPTDRIRELAREVGYAIGEHGTKERDLDLIAAPWADEAVGNHALFEHIAKGLGAKIVEIERKPLGRYAATLQMDGFYKPIDISVCAATKAAAPADAPRVEIARGRVWIVKGNQSFMLAYEPDAGDDPAEMQAYADQLRAALSSFTPDVKIAAPVPDTGTPTSGAVEKSDIDAPKSCWSCGRMYTAEQRLDADGNCPHCGVEIEDDAAPHPSEAKAGEDA